MCRAVPEIRMVVLALGMAVVAGVGVIALAHMPSVRRRFEDDARIRKGISIACATLCVIAGLLPLGIRGPLWRNNFV